MEAAVSRACVRPESVFGGGYPVRAPGPGSPAHTESLTAPLGRSGFDVMKGMAVFPDFSLPASQSASPPRPGTATGSCTHLCIWLSDYPSRGQSHIVSSP